MDTRGEMAPDPGRAIDVTGQTASRSGLGSSGPAHLPFGLSLSSSVAVPQPEKTLELTGFDHLALRVADIRRAEAFYHEFFQMDVLQRTRRVNGQWESIPADFDWSEGLRSGYYPEVVILRNGPITLLLLNAGRGTAIAEPRLSHVGLRVSSGSLAALRGVALIRSFTVTQDEPHAFRFIDPYGISWHLTDEGEGRI